MQEYVNPAHVCTWPDKPIVPARSGYFHNQAEAYSVEEETKISVYVTAELLCKCSCGPIFPPCLPGIV